VDQQQERTAPSAKSDLTHALVPKVCGADAELGNFILSPNGAQGTTQAASRLVLSEIEGVLHSSWARPAWSSGGHQAASRTSYGTCYDTYGGTAASYGGDKACNYDSQDWGRKFLPRNGGCAYIDMNHVELCIPEVLSAFDFVAAWHAMLRVARQALDQANARLGRGHRIQVLVNNSDGQGNSYGSHLNFLLSRRAFNDLFHRKPHYLSYLASFQVSSIVITGQGKVGAENGAPDAAYQLSQRADFFETLTALQTTYARPLINTRDEPLCGEAAHGKWIDRDTSPWARLHVIFYDNNLCQVANLLKCGMMQMLLAMLEAGCSNPSLILDDPLQAVRQYSHDPTLQARARAASGGQFTAVELQLLFLEESRKFAARGGFEGVVPRAWEILDLQADTLQKLRDGDLDAIAGRLDWVLKMRVLQRAMAQRPQLDWASPQIKHLDHAYSSLDANEGLYWAYESAGVVQRVVTPGQIEYFMHQPPEDTRAFTRAMLLRLAGPEQVDRVDWDSIRLELPGRSGWTVYRTIHMSNPFALTKAETGHLFASGPALEEVCEALTAKGQEGAASHNAPSSSAATASKAAPLLLTGPKTEGTES
jgi:proteasome accessory factor A